MRETEFYGNYLRPRLKAWGDHQRIETTTGSGVPDINYAIDQCHGWIETKVVHSGKLFFERFQLPWLHRRARFMGYGLYVLATNGPDLLLYEPSQLFKVPHTVVKKWVTIETKDLVSMCPAGKPWPWDLVKVTLARVDSLHLTIKRLES